MEERDQPDVRQRRFRKGFAPTLVKLVSLLSAALLLGAFLAEHGALKVSRSTSLAMRSFAGNLRRLEPAGRRLAAFQFKDDDSTSVVILKEDASAPVTCPNRQQCTQIGAMYAGLKLAKITLNIAGSDYDFDSQDARFRVVKPEVVRADAQAGACKYEREDTSIQISGVGGDWAGQGQLIQLKAGDLEESEVTDLEFKMGGTYRLCYSHEGDFEGDDVDILWPDFVVSGIYDNRQQCVRDETCLTKRPYRCYLLREAYNNMQNTYTAATSCTVDYSYDGAGVEGSLGHGSWSKAFATTVDDDGKVTVVPSECAAAGETPADFLCMSGGNDCSTGDPSVETKAVGTTGVNFSLPTGRNTLKGASFKAYTVAACYCAGGYTPQATFPACSQPTFFTQQVGILHFYVSKVCMKGYRSGDCIDDFTGVSPQHSFSLRVECPTDACSTSGASRTKLVVQKDVNDLPSWMPNSGCGPAQHGMYEWSDGHSTDALPADVNPDVTTLAGGSRQDYKLWNFWSLSNFNVAQSGFLFVMGSSDHELRSGQEQQTWDVCYCDDSCGNNANWFKVGQLRFAPFQLVSTVGGLGINSSDQDTSTEQEEFLVEYAMQEGMIGFYRPPDDHGVMALQEGGVIKLALDSSMSANDAFCQSAVYDSDLLGGLETAAVAKTHFAGTASPDGKRLLFNSGNKDNRITVKRAGYIAICYCSAIDPETEENGNWDCLDNHWVFTQHITVRGPGLGQQWHFSTHVTFSFEFTGWGLSSGDKVRIVPSTSTCDGDPSGAATETAVKLQCPEPCSAVGVPGSVVNGDISVGLLADNAYGCDKNNENCGNNDIKAIVVVDEHTTLVEFENPHKLSNGDFLQIGSLNDNIECQTGQELYKCNPERLAVLKGQYRLVDEADNSVSAPNYYVAGHAVTTTNDPTTVTIPVGWPDPKPTFVVQYQNAKRGKWIRHSKAVTAEEIMGTKTMRDMKVCWKYAQRNSEMSPKYVAEVGKMNLVEPYYLEDCKVSLTTTVKDQTAPFAPLIVSFKTGAAQTGARYGQVEGMTRLRIIFSQTRVLDPRFNDGGSIVSHPGEDEIFEAKQYICGKLFKEMWSGDAEMGFPLPRGCYYQVYGFTREIIVLFDARNGLRAGQDYQMVLNGVVHAGAVRNGKYVEILTMDDTDLNPYIAIERGQASLSKDPKNGAFGDSGVKFTNEGLQIMGGSDAGTLELSEGTVFSVELRGDTTGGGIKPSSILRIFMWPLTQWDLESTCTVTCQDYDVITAQCGMPRTCKGSATVTNFQRNYLEVVLPDDMEPMDEIISHTLHFNNLKFPTGGFFPSRVGAEISKADDTKPHYIESIGAFMFKPPDDGQVVGKLVNYFGDGNTKPFAGDQRNILYVNIVPAATLYSASQTGDAQMQLTLPQGYVCVEPDDVNGESGWKNQENLRVFDGQIPQGIGAPDNPDAATRGWTVFENTCTYKLRQNSAIFAGTSLMVRVTVDNPAEALQRDNDTNEWKVTLSSKGHSTVTEHFPPVSFATTSARYSKSVAVLGHVTESSLVPTNFAITPDAFQPSEGKLRVFLRAEQSTGVFSRVHLRAPGSFGFDFCRAQDLEDSYYATRNGDRTRRLPGILSCAYFTEPYSHVEVRLEGEVLAGERYAFSVTAVNPMSFTPGPLTGWQVYTLSSAGYLIDGSEGSLSFVNPHVTSLNWGGSASESFGMYRTQLNNPQTAQKCADISISDMRPYSISGQYATATVSPLCLPELATTTLRIIAPHGFVWGNATTDGDFSDMPGGAPENEGNVLVWSTPVQYQSQAAKVYSFTSTILVPDHYPTRTVNDFIFEFGFDATTVQGRVSAAVVPAMRVRGLVNAQLEYESNLANEDTRLIFQIETITDIPSGGKLTITGPQGYQFLTGCTPVAAPRERGSPYDVDSSQPKMLPPDVNCRSEVLTDVGGSPSGVKIELTAGGQGIKAGLLRFQLDATNPEATSPPVADQSSACGYSCCWGFASRDLSGADLDAPLSIPCFGVNRRMDGDMPTLTAQQRRDTGRDDRPLKYNPIVFVMSLSEDAKYAGYMRIRGPEGVVFQEDCKQDVQTEETKVFGEGTVLDTNQYTAWPTDVKVASCRGEGPDAYLYIVPVFEGSSGFNALSAYPFRIAIYMNPATPPKLNFWTIEFNQESAQLFPGFDLWTFSGTSLHTVTTARSTSVASEPKFANPVTMTFNPTNTIVGPGMKIQVMAPEFYEFAHVSYTCQVLIQPVGNHSKLVPGVPYPNYDGPPSLIWGDGDTECMVDALNVRRLSVTVKAERIVFAGTDYQITVFVHNPTFVSQTTIGDVPIIGHWELQTFESPAESGVLSTFRDLVTIPGYQIDERPNEMLVKNNGNIQEGNAKVRDLYFQVSMPNNMEKGDQIVIQAPRDFDLEDKKASTPGQCLNFTWEENILPNSPITCVGGLMTFDVQENQNIKEGEQMMFRIVTTNPVETPHVMQNNWIVSHIDPALGIMATQAKRSWSIVAQLDKVDIQLVGQHKAAGQKSSIRISFLPVSTADELELHALMPSGVSFTGAVATSFGHEVISTNENIIRVQAAIFADVMAEIVIDQMTLGTPGGQTKFNLVTRLNNGEQMDESVAFEGGFVQPGLLTVMNQDIKSMFNLDATTYPVASQWGTRMSEKARATFIIKNTMETAAGVTLVISSETLLSTFYLMMVEDFDIIWSNAPAGAAMVQLWKNATVISGSSISAVLEAPLLANQEYEVHLTVETPAVRSATASSWRIEAYSDYGDADKQQLINTNDATTSAFRLVDRVILTVRPDDDAPPTAIILARVTVDPQSTNPTEIILVAPPGFNFTDNCLETGGWYNEITACTRDVDIAGRASARLTCQDGGISQEVAGIRVRVITPAESAADPTWYVSVVNTAGDQEGWGHDPVGFEVKQMLGSTVVYSGVPDMSGLMIVGFITQKQVPTGGKIQVGHPPSFIIQCDGAFFNKLGLRGNFACISGEGFFELEIDYPISIGQQAFAVTITPPSAVQEDNLFFIKLLEPSGDVIDAAMEIPGIPVQHGLPMTALDLTWSNSEPGQRSTVSLGFELVNNLPDTPPALSELVVELPPDFTQQVTNSLHIEWTDRSMPYQQPTWLDSSDASRLNLYLNEELCKDLQTGTYRFSFPVKVPSLVPAYNVYVVTLCKPHPDNTTSGKCVGWQDDRALVSFPVIGFKLGDEHPTALKDSASNGAFRRVSPAAAPLLLAAGLLAAALC